MSAAALPILALLLLAQAPPVVAPASAPGVGSAIQDPTALDANPFEAPKEMDAFFARMTSPGTLAMRLQTVLTGIFAPAEAGGLGMQYDNERTRTVAEVWKERKANCLSLTAFFVEASRAAGLTVRYAEALNTMRWTRVKGMIRKERHVVALGEHRMGGDDLVADFLPRMRRRMGAYMVRTLQPNMFRALFHANRAVECLDEQDFPTAAAHAEKAVLIDGKSTSVWNIRGVVYQRKGDFVEAERSFRTALTLDEGDAATHGNLEILLRNLGRTEEAQQVYDRSLQLRKKDPYFQFFLAEEALEKRDLAEAESRIKVAIKIHKQESEFHLLRARIHLERGEIEKATACIAEAQKWANPLEKARYENKMEALKRQESLRPK